MLKHGIHTTNYKDAFITVADDCLVKKGALPAVKGAKPSVAALQFELLADHPYEYTSDDVLFTVHAARKDIPEEAWVEARELFFSKGQACMRASPLTKRYGWGVHFDGEGKIALYGCETEAYQHFLNDQSLKQVSAMRSAK